MRKIENKPSNENWRNGKQTLVRILLVSLEDPESILIQKRSFNKRDYPGFWTESATGHVEVGEKLSDAAHREMQEEIGLETSLSYQGSIYPKDSGLFEHHLFLGSVSRTSRLLVDKGEVELVKWVNYRKILNGIDSKQDKYTPGLIASIKKTFDNNDGK